MNTFPDNKPALKQFKSTRQHPLKSAVRTLYQLAESVITRIEVLERSDEKFLYAKCLHSRRSNDTTGVSDEDDREDVVAPIHIFSRKLG